MRSYQFTNSPKYRAFHLSMGKRICEYGRLLLVFFGLIFLLAIFGAKIARADNYLEVCGIRSGTADTIGSTTHFLHFGDQIAIFLPPYTAYFTVSPLGDSSFLAEISFNELLPGLKTRNKTVPLILGQWLTEDSLPGKGEWYSYSFRVIRDTLHRFEYFPKDSLVNDESIHFRAWLLKDSYADYKWQARKDYLEGYFDEYRKELKITRSGKINCFVLPAANYSADMEINGGIGFNIPHGYFYLVFNENFDSALPENIQRFVIYETWGYSARSLVVGFSRYYLDDTYQAKKILKKLSPAKIRRLLLDETPSNITQADIISGAFVKYLIDKFSFGDFRLLYEKSSAGKLPVKNIFHKDLEELINNFINYEKKTGLSEAAAFHFSEMFRSQLWFDRALEYDTYLASGTDGLRFLKRLAAGLFYLGRYAQSESCYARLAQFKREDNEAHYLAASARFRTGKYEKAIAGLKEISDKFRSAAKTLAEYYLDRNQPDSAAVILEKIAGAPDSWTAIMKARLALAGGDTTRADTFTAAGIELSENTISNIPGEGRGYIDNGNCLMYLRQYEAARVDFETALFLENRPYYRGMALLALGRLFDLQNDHTRAISYYNRSISQNPGKYYISLAKSYIANPFRVR